MFNHSMIMRFASRSIRLVIAGLFVVLALSPTLCEAATQKILVVNAYHRGFKWTDSITSGIESVLETGPDSLRRQVEYIYLDTKRVYSSEYLQKLRDIYRFKFRPNEFDVIIVSDNNALDFLVQHREEIFGTTPVVFCGINDYQPELIQGATGYTGVNELPDLQGNIELILKLHPAIKELVLIEDDTPTGQRTHAQLTALEPQYADRLRFRYFQKLAMADLQMRLGSLPDDSVVLYTTFFRDATGRFFEYDESASMISAASAVPVYATWDFSLGYGVVGGKLTDGFSQGESAARMALDILAGTPPEQIPVRMDSPSRFMFDAKPLKRFAINQAKLPTESLLINQPDRHYQNLLIGSSTSILVLGTLLTILLVINYRRKQAERAMRLSEERLQALMSNSVVGIGITDQEGRYLKLNQTWEKMLRLPNLKSIKAHRIQVETPPDELGLRQESFEKLIQGHISILRQERQFLRADGSCFWGDHTLIPIRDEKDRVTATISMTVDITQRKLAENEIRQMAYYDPLTGLPNRSLLQDRLGQAIRQARRDNQILGLFFLDLDRFKAINDSLGHDAGDQLLKKVADRLGACVRQSDTVARLGGDEFVILLSALQTRKAATDIAEKVLLTMQQPFDLDGNTVSCTTSIGAALFPYDGLTEDHLLKHADTAMYTAKTKGRNLCEFFSGDLHSFPIEATSIETDLRRALSQDELFLEYQPQYQLKQGTMVGVEARLRWQHPTHGRISPNEFIPLAEDTGLIHPIGYWMLHTACAQGAAWCQQSTPLRISVSLSRIQLARPDLVNMVKTILQQTELPPHLLELELAEAAWFQKEGDTLKIINDLQTLGIQLALRDFGTGLNSVEDLASIPVDRIKIDRRLIHTLGTETNDRVIVETLLSMAQQRQLPVIAKGVETEAQLQFLQQKHCPEGQGFYLSHPLGSDTIAPKTLCPNICRQHAHL